MNIFCLFFYNITMKTISKILLTIYLLTLLLISIFQFQYSVLISLVLLIPLIKFKTTLYKIEYLIYVYLTQVLGTTCQFYSLPYYDKIMHFLSGMVFVIIAYFLFKNDIKQKSILYIFINCVEATIAFLWEVFEYSGLILFNYDASRHYTTGVHDTMQDMIFSFLAGLIITFIIYKYPFYIDSLYKSQPDSFVEVSQQSHI